MVTYLPAAAILLILSIVAMRATLLYRRGIRVVVIDPRRTASEKFFETFAFVVFVFWIVLLGVYADGDGPAWLPSWLDAPLLDVPAAQWTGAVLVAGGVVLFILALLSMGDSWRMGIDRSAINPPPLKGGARGGIPDPSISSIDAPTDPPLTQPLPSGERSSATPLVTTGLFARSRNPIYVAFDLVVIGSFLIHGRVIFLIAAALLIVIWHIQIRREERFLFETHGQAFVDYCQRTNRYGPWNF